MCVHYYDLKLTDQIRPYLHNNVYKQISEAMTLARIVKALEFTAMITQTSWVQNIVTDTMKESEDMKNLFILVIHF